MAKVYAVQFDIVHSRKDVNFEIVSGMLRTEHPYPGSVILLSEFFSTGFSADPESFAEMPSGFGFGATSDFLSALADEFNCTVVANGVVFNGGMMRNREAVFRPGRLDAVAYYDKIHPYSAGGENLKIEGGDFVGVFSFAGMRVAMLVCYDLRFPEPFRAAAFAGCHAVFISASWPSHREEYWKTLLRARAMENQMYIVGANRVGSDPYYSYSGSSMIVGPDGAILKEAGTSSCIISAEISADAVCEQRRTCRLLDDARFRGELPRVIEFEG